jgi:uncharacterized glyoxalase superfamily protein PhnB
MADQAPTLYPSLSYRDAPRAIQFLHDAFGFQKRVVYPNGDGTIAHAELSVGPSVLMLGTDRDDPLRGSRAGQGWLYVAVDDADAHCARARAAGATIVTELHDTDYGSRDYAARDPEGNLWSFGTYRPAAAADAAETPHSTASA